MKISNRLFNDQQIKQFSKQMEDIQNIQAKISSGKNIIFASDDPVGACMTESVGGATTAAPVAGSVITNFRFDGFEFTMAQPHFGQV